MQKNIYTRCRTYDDVIRGYRQAIFGAMVLYKCYNLIRLGQDNCFSLVEKLFLSITLFSATSWGSCPSEKNRSPNTPWNTAFIGKWNNGRKPGTNEWHLSSGGNTNDVPAFTIEMGRNKYRIDNSEQLSLNTWYPLVAGRRTTSIELYVNGKLKSTLQVPVGEINNIGRSLLFGKFGGDAGAAVYYNQGAKIDEVMIFNRALNPQEINTLFSGEAIAIEPLTPKAPANLVQNILCRCLILFTGKRPKIII